MAIREVKEGTQYQGADEELAYSITTTNWGSSPSSSSAKAYDENYNREVEIILTKRYDLNQLTSYWESETYLGSLRVIPSGGISVKFVAIDQSGHVEEIIKILSD